MFNPYGATILTRVRGLVDRMRLGDIDEQPRKGRGVDRTVGVLISLGLHLVLIGAILLIHTPPKLKEAGPVSVVLVDAPTPFPSAAALAAAAPAAPPPPPSPPAVSDKPSPVKAKPAPKRPPRRTPPAPPARDSTPQIRTVAEVGEAELVGAATAGSGGEGGRSCDMVRRLQAELRADAKVHRVLQQVRLTPGKAVLVWNGNWVQHPGEDGEGLAGIREAMLMEIGFAPEACRAQPMRGMVMISLGDNAGAARIAFGSGGAWRWADLLRSRSSIGAF